MRKAIDGGCPHDMGKHLRMNTGQSHTAAKAIAPLLTQSSPPAMKLKNPSTVVLEAHRSKRGFQPHPSPWQQHRHHRAFSSLLLPIHHVFPPVLTASKVLLLSKPGVMEILSVWPTKQTNGPTLWTSAFNLHHLPFAGHVCGISSASPAASSAPKVHLTQLAG